MDAPKSKAIYAAMVAVMGELPAIGKDTANPKLGFKYRAVDDIIAALNPLMVKHRVAFTPHFTVVSRDSEPRSGGGFMRMVVVQGTFTFYSAIDDSFIEATALGEGFDTADKATMKAETAALKVALGQVFLIATHNTTDPDGDNPDSTAPHGTAGKAPSGGPPRSMAEDTGVPAWWRRGTEIPQANGIANDETGTGIPVTGCIRFDADTLPESGPKEKRWLSLNKTPWESMTWLETLRAQVLLIRKGIAPTTENSPLEWLLSTNGRCAYKGKANWNGETAVALVYFAEKIAEKKGPLGSEPDIGRTPAPAPKPTTPPQDDGLNLDDIPF